MEEKNIRDRLENLTGCERKKKCPSTEAKGTQDGLGCVLTAPPVCWSGKDVARLALARSQRAAAYWLTGLANGLCPRDQSDGLFVNIDQELHGPNIRSHSVLKGRVGGYKLQ